VFADIDQEALAHTLWMKEELFGDLMTDFFHKKPIDYAKKAQSFDQVLIFGTDEEIAAYYEQQHSITSTYGTVSRDLILYHK
jgi:hypothetical protein